jgi:hypothetical protein
MKDVKMGEGREIFLVLNDITVTIPLVGLAQKRASWTQLE